MKVGPVFIAKGLKLQIHQYLTKEPLVHFFVLACAIFLLEYWVSQGQKDNIIISQQSIDFLIKQRENLELRQLDDQERDATINQFIEDEILYKEAYKRGLDQGDSRMRRNLIFKMRGLLTSEIGESTDESLLDWYTQNQQRYTLPENWSVEQIFFSHGSAFNQSLLQQLKDGLNPVLFQSLGAQKDLAHHFKNTYFGKNINLADPTESRSVASEQMSYSILKEGIVAGRIDFRFSKDSELLEITVTTTRYLTQQKTIRLWKSKNTMDFFL